MKIHKHSLSIKLQFLIITLALSIPIATNFYALPVMADEGITYYVDISGQDSNSGNASQPWRTIQKAANTLVAGDTVIVNSGIYEETITETSSGTDSETMITYTTNGNVTIRGFYVRGNYIKLEGFIVTPINCGSWNGAIDISGSYCLIQNNTVKDSTRQGIVNYGTTTGNRIINNIITRTHLSGMLISGQNHLIENNDISHIADHINTCSIHTEANGIDFHGSNNTFRGNYIHDFYKSEQNGNPHVDAFQTYSDLGNGKPAAKDTLFESNHIFMGNSVTGKIEEAISGNQGFHAFMIEGKAEDTVNNITLKNNIIESWGGWNGNPGNLYNIKIYNNIWRSSNAISSSYWPAGIQLAGVTGFEIFNNILIDYSYSHVILSNGSSQGIYDYNLMWNSNGSAPRLIGYTAQSHDKINVNPLFVLYNISDLLPDNFQLQLNSPAIDSGITLLQVIDDYAGVLRPQGSGYDIGPYEFQSSITPTLSPTSTVCLGDMNGDRLLNTDDLRQVFDRWLTVCSNCPEDLNLDDKINIMDVVFITSYWNRCN